MEVTPVVLAAAAANKAKMDVKGTVNGKEKAAEALLVSPFPQTASR